MVFGPGTCNFRVSGSTGVVALLECAAGDNGGDVKSDWSDKADVGDSNEFLTLA